MVWLRVFVDWLDRRRALSEFKRHHSDTLLDDSWKFKNQLSLAQDYIERDTPQTARTIILQLLGRYPEIAMQSEDMVRTMMRLQLLAEAEEMMTRSHRRYPHDRKYIRALAEIAEGRGDYDETLRWCAMLRKRFPADFTGYGLAARQLSKAGNIDDAEKLLAQGLKFAGDNAGAAIEYARIPMVRKDWETGLERWRIVSERFRHHSGPISMAECLRNLGRFDEAEAVLKEAQPRHPLEPGIRSGLAWVAEARGDKVAAFQYWDQVRQRFPMLTGGYIGSVRILRELGRDAEAEEVRKEAIGRFPDLSIR